MKRFESDPNPPSAPAQIQRLLAAAAIGVAAGFYFWTRVRAGGLGAGGDFEVNWIAARAVGVAANPVTAVSSAGWPWPLYYPMPAHLVSLLFAWLPFPAAESLFVAVGAGLLAFGMTRRAWWGLLIFLSASYFHAFFHAQWSPLLVGAMLTPWLGGLLAAKPSVGLAYFFSRPSWKAVAGGLLLILISFLVEPGWIGQWRNAIAGASHISPPVMRPGGFVLLAALPFWRRADARLLIGLALVPHVTMLYETVPLFTIPRSFRQMAVLVILSAVAAVTLLFVAPLGPPDIQRYAEMWPVLLVTLYVPALVMVLWNARRDRRMAPFEHGVEP
jgi:hypothetical protein